MKPFVAQGFDWYTIYWRGSPCKQGKRSGFTADFRGKKRIGQRLNARRYVWSERGKGASRGEPRSILFDAYRNAPESVPHHSEPVGKEGGRGKGNLGGCSPLSEFPFPRPAASSILCGAGRISRKSRAARRRCRTGSAGGIQVRARRFSSLQWPARIPGWDSWWRRGSGI